MNKLSTPVKDRYTKRGESIRRLIQEYNKYQSLIVAFDFDNTIYDYHKCGDTYPRVIELLKDLHEINCKLICFTSNEDLDFVARILKDKEIEYDGININPSFFNSKSPKIYYNVLLDDRAGLRQVIQELEILVEIITKKL